MLLVVAHWALDPWLRGALPFWLQMLLVVAHWALDPWLRGALPFWLQMLLVVAHWALALGPGGCFAILGANVA